MIVILFICLAFTSCATMINGKEQKINVVTQPAGATVSVDGAEKGVTPLVVTLPRKTDHVVEISKSGYNEYTTQLKRTLSGVALLYILPGGSLSLVADMANGSQFELEPRAIRIRLTPLLDAKALMATQFSHLKSMSSKLSHKEVSLSGRGHPKQLA